MLDTETQKKVAAHQNMRGPNWHTIEEPVELAEQYWHNFPQDQLYWLIA
jgi:adenosyl cobinamide kinase/adenosyl cobinamide phosphate guanylyltransferase